MNKLTFSLEGYTLRDIFYSEVIEYDESYLENNRIDFLCELQRNELNEYLFEILENRFGDISIVNMSYRVEDLGDGTFELQDQGYLVRTIDGELNHFILDGDTSYVVLHAKSGLSRLVGYEQISSDF